MTTVSILPANKANGARFYRAFTGSTEASGNTIGQALDAIIEQLGEDSFGSLVIMQGTGPDPYFNQRQIDRLFELMNQWRAARDGGQAFSVDLQRELDCLVERELKASGIRASAYMEELRDYRDWAISFQSAHRPL